MLESKMHVEGDWETVRKDILENGPNGREGQNRPVFLLLGGVMRGVEGGGGVSALNELGLDSNFHSVVGVSTGAPASAYFLTGKASIGTSIYYEECLTSNFMSIINFLFKGKRLINIKFVGSVWRGILKGSEHKKIDTEVIKNSKTDLYVTVTNCDTGRGVLKKINDAEDPVSYLEATCAIPLLTETKILCDGTYYTDGAMSLSFPVREVIAKVNPTSILVFPNRSKNYFDGRLVRFYERVLHFLNGENIAKNLYDKQGDFYAELKILREQEIPYAIIWSDDKISSFNRNKKELIAAKNRFKHFILKLFDSNLK